ncbi:POTRA domain-containing protein [Pigmentiphaga soli]|uniref:POTRA domain-containing protein n=1 Tax=Pigmentiphaga soli TaxID=1007095 RepID=A0ABP8H6D9_9BURK
MRPLPRKGLPRLHPSNRPDTANRPPARPALLAALLLAAGSAAPQTPPLLPPGAEPGREAPLPIQPPTPAPGGAVVVPPSQPGVQAPAGAENIRFTLTAVDIEGSTAYGADALRPLYAGRLGKEITVADAFRIAAEIELRYRNAGFVTTRVLVPEQTIADGRLRIVVVEGFIAEIVYQDSVGPARQAIEKLLSPLRGMRPVSVEAIERRLLLANDLPGMTVRATLEPSPTTQGASVIVVRSERKAIDAQFTVDNRASPYLDSNEMVGSVSFNGLGARADRLALSARGGMPVDRNAFAGANYDALLSDNGLMLGLATGFARSRPGRELEPLDVRSRVTSNSGTLTYPLIRSRRQNLRAFGQFEMRDVDTDLSGVGFTRDRLRVVRAGLSYDLTDSWNGITALRGTVHQGLSGLGASDPGSVTASRPNGRPDFLKFTAEASRLQQLSPRVSLFAAFTGQFSADPLLASEEIALGGTAFGRGYDVGEIAADNGVAGSVEIRYVPSVPDVLPRGLQLYGFVDGGHVWAHSGGNQPLRQTVASFGGGLRANLSRSVYASLELAKPINTVVATRDNKHPRVFFTLTLQY